MDTITLMFVLCVQSAQIWLGGLFTPEAYITAMRQHVARAKKWSLEELCLNVSNTHVSQTAECLKVWLCGRMQAHISCSVELPVVVPSIAPVIPAKLQNVCV